MKKKLLAALIKMAIVVVIAAASAAIVFWVSGEIIVAVLMSMCMIIAFGMVWLCVYETLGG